MKRLYVILLVSILVFTMVGCDSKAKIDTEPSVKKETITLWSYYETEAQQASLDMLIQEFNLSQEKYTASWSYIPMEDFTKRLSIGVTENQLPDMVIIDNPDMSTYVNLDLFEDISSYLNKWSNTDDYYPQVWKSVQYNGRYYGIPFCCNNVALIYNTDMLEQANIDPPKSWEDFSLATQKLTNADHYGFAMSAAEGEQSAFQILPWILSTGETIPTIGSNKTRRAFTYLQELLKNGYMDTNCINWSQNDVARKFVAGETAMMENGPWVLPILQQEKISYGITALPVDEKSVIITGGENLGVIKGKNIDGAMAFLEYYNQDSVMQRASKMAYALPPKVSLAEQLARENSDYAIFVEQMKVGMPRSLYTQWTQISNLLSEASYNLMTGEATPKEITRDLKHKMKELMEQEKN